jgi:hypothetical protein
VQVYGAVVLIDDAGAGYVSRSDTTDPAALRRLLGPICGVPFSSAWASRS